MQFHHHGYVTGDPRVQPAAGSGADRPAECPAEVDVLIVGAGPAGMVTAAQLAQFPDLTTRIIEKRPGRLEVGQADGIQARSVETFQAFGFANRVTEEAYRITEMAFWNPDPDDPSKIVRTDVPIDDPTGISEFPHLIVNEARILDYFAEAMANAPARITPDYGLEFIDLSIVDGDEHPVHVTLRDTVGPQYGAERTVRAKYVVGCDGASSRVRASIGRELVGQQANHAWGVLDALAVTDFPDIRTKCAIQSGSRGSILHIPREGGFLFRMYVDLGEVPEHDQRRVRDTTVEETIDRANEILHPYTLDVRHVARYTVYEVGHRLTDKFDDVADSRTGDRTPRVFITGDACHTHSAKAGQGMNVSIQDGFNLAWKLGHVVCGLSPETLLTTYSAERQVVAANLIDFDQQWSAMMAKKPDEFDDPNELEQFYIRTFEFPAGFMTEYQPSMITGDTLHQHLATGFPVGKRFKSARVSRVAEGNPAQLGHHAFADGRWRIYAFADRLRPGDTSALTDWADWIRRSADSPVVRFTRPGSDPDSVFDVKVIYQQPHGEIEFADVPEIFRPQIGPFALVDHEKVYGTLPEDDIFDVRGIDRDGAVIVVRPDQYVAQVLPLDDTAALARFFATIMREPDRRSDVADR